MSTTANLKNVYAEQIAPALMKQFNYSSPMQIPVLKKIVINQGLGMATADKKVIEIAMNELAHYWSEGCSYNVKEGYLKLQTS